jgi:threonine dehydrogenase-like Zn-dependent dehydrogenase
MVEKEVGPSKKRCTFTICDHCKFLVRGGVAHCGHKRADKVAVYYPGNMIGYIQLPSDEFIHLTPDWCPANGKTST